MEDGTTRKTRGNERREGGGRAHHGGEAGLPKEPPIPPPGKRAAGRYAASAGGLRNPLLALLPELVFFLQMMLPEYIRAQFKIYNRSVATNKTAIFRQAQFKILTISILSPSLRGSHPMRVAATTE
jgi:hypothetical protein